MLPLTGFCKIPAGCWQAPLWPCGSPQSPGRGPPALPEADVKGHLALRTLLQGSPPPQELVGSLPLLTSKVTRVLILPLSPGFVYVGLSHIEGVPLCGAVPIEGVPLSLARLFLFPWKHKCLFYGT